jgi:3D (Asp-Asp-Asp) domain-containing protein
VFNFPVVHGEVLGTSSQIVSSDSLNKQIHILTTTAFDQKESTETITIPFEIVYEKNKDMEYGKEEVAREGVDGKKTLTYLVTFWKDEEIDRQLISTEIENPIEEKVFKGTKIVWKMLEDTEYGGLKYWYKMRVWATKYDGNCYGCSGRTFSGTSVVKGVCATDPKTIPLGTNFYVVGYGMCRAEDIGGAIKGNKIDLGFEVAAKGAWGSSYTDVYLLTNAPVE